MLQTNPQYCSRHEKIAVLNHTCIFYRVVFVPYCGTVITFQPVYEDIATVFVNF